MKCSSCKTGTLEASRLDGLFNCHTCTHCGGNLILLGDFMQWQKNNPEEELRSEAKVEIVAEETSKAMVCPLSGKIMTKYRISADTEHRLDLSPSINAVWLDKGEWRLLKEKGLADNINNIFTDHWQHNIHEEETSEVLNELYIKKFGEHYQAIKAFKRVLNKVKNPRQVVAYLLADDPYSANK